MHIRHLTPNDQDAGGDEPVPGEFDRLLREIENEAVPARLLELALELQAALAELRRQRKDDAGPAGK